jgi:hypothetical protein
MIVEVEREHTDWQPHRIAQHVLRKMSAEQRRNYLAYLLTIRVKGVRRSRVHAIEARAQQMALRAQREREESERERVRQTERDEMWRKRRAERERLAATHPRYAHPSSKIYKKWIITPEGAAFDAERKRERAERERLHREGIEHRKRERAEVRRQRELAREHEREREREIDEHGGPEGWSTWRLQKIIDEFADKIRVETRLELTRELLSAEFALGDGRTVTWGDATAHDHAQRIDLLLKNAHGSVETANRHRVAIAMLAEHETATLREIATTLGAS